jgi:hypothetical protein
MTDTSNFLPNSKGLTSDLMYSLKPSSVPCRSYRGSIPTTNSQTFLPGSLAILYIPGGRRNTFYDGQQSFLRITVQNNETVANLNIDNNAGCFLNRLDVFSGSNILETIQNFNLLYGLVSDIQASTSQKIGLQNSMGFGTDVNGRSGVQIPPGGVFTFCVPLLSGVVGTKLDKLLPVHALADDIRIELTMESNTTAVAWSAAPTGQWKIIDLQLECCMVELSDEGMGMVQQMTPANSPVYLHGSSYRHYISSLPSGYAGSYSSLVPARFASLKTLTVLPRRSTEQVDPLSYSLSSRINPNISTYNWRLGSAIVPQKPVNLINANTTGGYGEGFQEIMKAWHSLGSFEYSSSLPYAFYNVADAASVQYGGVVQGSTGANSYKNGFLIELELESIANRSDVILSGTNTLSNQVFFEAVINTAPTATYALDIFATFDHILILENGILSVKF